MDSEPTNTGTPVAREANRAPGKLPKGKAAAAKVGGTAGVSAYPESVERLISGLAALPGIGRRSAERLAFHILKSDAAMAKALAGAICDVKSQVRHCSICYNLADTDPCPICAGAVSGPNGAARDRGLVMVVEQPRDLIALEQTGMFKGVYHVLMGRISPLDGIGPGDLTVADLFVRAEEPARNAGGEAVREVVLALNPTLEGDGTALYLAHELQKRGVQVTRLARGLPAGSQLEFASKAVLADAIDGRRPV
ncbi:MAG: recombination protein RecR [Phycisphaerales bacterium]|nr:recombination protein RecR [Phycisphaerales bacterium]